MNRIGSCVSCLHPAGGGWEGGIAAAAAAFVPESFPHPGPPPLGEGRTGVIKIQFLIWLFLLMSVPSFAATGDETFATAERLRLSSYYAQAEAEYRKLLPERFYGRRRDVLLGLGECLLMEDRVDDLMQLATRAVEEYPDAAYAHAGLAVAWAARARKSAKFYYAINQSSEATRHVSAALRLDPDCALARHVRGLIHFHMPKYLGVLPAAASDFEKVIGSLDPLKNRILADAYLHLALTYRRLRENRKAALILDRAQRLYPNRPEFRELYARYREEDERYGSPRSGD